MPIQALLIAISVFFVAGFFFVLRRIFRAHAQQRAQLTKMSFNLPAAQRVSELMSMYIDILLRHGPDSQEAEAFRFGVQNEELWQNSASSDAMKIYVMFTEICDNAFRRNANECVTKL